MRTHTFGHLLSFGPQVDLPLGRRLRLESCRLGHRVRFAQSAVHGTCSKPRRFRILVSWRGGVEPKKKMPGSGTYYD